MDFDNLFKQSNDLALDLIQVIDRPLFDDSQRLQVSDLLCSLSMEHGDSTRALLQTGLLPSALVIHRAQFEAVMRAIWTLYAATDDQLARMTPELSLGTEQAAKKLPNVSVMIEELDKKAPPNAVTPLREFIAYNWKALNSYTHAGIHPLRRHQNGYPPQLVVDALMNVNGMSVLAAMQASILTGVPDLQRKVLEAASRYPTVLRPR
ncbi:DUF6988 family protein [Pseudoxanthomonas mexicana]